MVELPDQMGTWVREAMRYYQPGGQPVQRYDPVSAENLLPGMQNMQRALSRFEGDFCGLALHCQQFCDLIPRQLNQFGDFTVGQFRQIWERLHGEIWKAIDNLRSQMGGFEARTTKGVENLGEANFQTASEFQRELNKLRTDLGVLTQNRASLAETVEKLTRELGQAKSDMGTVTREVDQAPRVQEQTSELAKEVARLKQEVRQASFTREERSFINDVCTVRRPPVGGGGSSLSDPRGTQPEEGGPSAMDSRMPSPPIVRAGSLPAAHHTYALPSFEPHWSYERGDVIQLTGPQGRNDCFEGPRAREDHEGPRPHGDCEGPRARVCSEGPRARGDFEGPRAHDDFKGPARHDMEYGRAARPHVHEEPHDEPHDGPSRRLRASVDRRAGSLEGARGSSISESYVSGMAARHSEVHGGGDGTGTRWGGR